MLMGGLSVKRVFYLLDKIMDYAVFLILLALVIIGGMQVLCRYAFNYSLTWSEEVLRYLLIWLVFFAMGVGLRRNAHIGMNIVVDKLPPKGRQIMGSLVYVVAMVFSGILIFYTREIIKVTIYQMTPSLGISIGVVYCGVLIGSIYTFIVGLRRFIESMGMAIDTNKG
jgi:TRAP-type C4-dicarboxylate transport system permease small subunit